MRFFSVSLFLAFSYWCNAQFPADIRFTNYNRNNGLQEEYINNILQDSRGYLWLGSREGLIRFDGLNFKIWYANNSDSAKFASNNINVIEEYKPGYVLFTSGVSLWQINIFNHRLTPITRFAGKEIIVKPKRINPDLIFISAKDSLFITDNNFNILHSFQTANYYDRGTLVNCFPLQPPFALLYEHGHNRTYLLNYITSKTFPFSIDVKMLDGRAPFYIPQAYDSTTHRLYLSAYFNGNFYCDLKLPEQIDYTPVPLRIQPDGAILKTILLPGNRMMQVGNFGLHLVSDSNRRYYNSNIVTGNTLPATAVLDICKTSANNYWLATTNGISRFSLDEPVFKFSRHEPTTFDINNIKSILKENDNTIYLLTESSSLIKFNKEEQEFTQVENKLIYAWSAVRQADEITATGGGKKIFTYNTVTGKINYPSFLQPFYTTNTDIVSLAFIASNGDKWYSCNGSAGLIHNPSNSSQFIHYSRQSSPPAFSHSYVHCAAEDSKGNIWWGNNKSATLLKWDASKKIFEEKLVGSIISGYSSTNGVNNVYVDATDNLWIALDGAGVIKYNLKTLKGEYYDINKGLPTDIINAITSDAKNRIWMGTRKGLSCYLPEKNKIVTFTIYDGLPDDNFESRGIQYDKDENLLYIGAKNTIAWFNPDSLLNKTTSQQPVIFIDGMLVNGKPYYFDDEKRISLNPGENNIEFSFSAVDYTRSSQLEFQYLLSGSPGEWTESGESRKVSFNNLPSGSYTLSVRCRYKGNDNWVETKYPFSFTILTPWYKTLWFRLLLAVVIGIVSWLLIKSYYQRKLEKQKLLIEKELAIEQERTRMARELHDGLGSMLSGIKHSFSALEKQVSMDEPQQQRFHSTVEKLNETISELRNISHSMATENSLKFGLENSLRDYCRNIGQPAGVNISFSALNTESIKLGKETTFHIFRIIQELLQNIIKHAKASNAIVQISSSNNKFYVTVEDDGKGFDINSLPVKKNRPDDPAGRGMGLKNIEARVKIIKGHIDFKTAPGKGTSVMIEIPVI